MVRLFIDTSSDYLSLVLAKDREVLSSLRLLAGHKMSEILLGQIENIAKCCRIDIAAVDEFYAITGPGSFTGVRIGVAMAMGLAEGASKACYGLTSIDAAAMSSGYDNCSVISRLKGNIFTVKHYDFINNKFSNYYAEEIDESSICNYIVVNDGSAYPVMLEKAVVTGKWAVFRSECIPLYIRKSEAELNIDKKRHNA